jgi:hypothetical protein
MDAWEIDYPLPTESRSAEGAELAGYQTPDEPARERS